jgi:CheY-like chemotaxis protein
MTRLAGTVVVADDLEANLDLFTRLLTRDGYTIHSAGDGAAALELVMRHHPDLVLSDVVMPKLDGFELCRRIKAEKATRLTPVVLVTSLGDREDRSGILHRRLDRQSHHRRARQLRVGPGWRRELQRRA